MIPFIACIITMIVCTASIIKAWPNKKGTAMYHLIMAALYIGMWLNRIGRKYFATPPGPKPVRASETWAEYYNGLRHSR